MTIKLIFILDYMYSEHYRNKVVTTAMLASKLFTIAVAITLTQYFMFYFYTIWKYSDYEIKKLPIG